MQTETIRHIEFNFDPTQVVSISERIRVVNQYADIWFESGQLHGTLAEFAEQCSMDWKDPSMALEIKRAIRRQERKAA